VEHVRDGAAPLSVTSHEDFTAVTLYSIERISLLLFNTSNTDTIYERIVRFEAFVAVTMKNVVFWDVAQCKFFFLILDCEAIGTAATSGLLWQPRVIMKMIVEKQMESRLVGETEVLGENLPQRHFCPSQNPT
jgi:hypothetical protein